MITKNPWRTSVGLIVAFFLLVGFCPGVAHADVDLSPTTIIKKAYVDTKLGQIHYRYTTGPKNAPVLILIHQTTSDSEMFEQIMTRMGKYYSKIIAPDFPGYGESFQATDEQASGIPFYADTFMEALDNLGIKKAHLCGHHTGGCIALDMKSRWPNRFYSLIIMGPIYGDQQFRKDLRAITTEQIDKIRPVADGSHLLRGWKAVETYGAASVEGIDDVVAFHQREAIAHLKGWKAGKQAYHAALEQDFPALFDKVPGPLMIMCAPKNVLWPFFEPSKKARPDAEVAVVKGHDYFCDEDPDNVAKYVVNFTQKYKK
jgi:pimeloyl-ACP methyl ester carboxylesterase